MENLEQYSRADIVAHYVNAEGLQRCEGYIFDRYLHPNLDILDLGVGGGRTTPHLTKFAKRYVGADYSLPMVEACKRKWPELDFRHCDAGDLSQFKDNEFDAVVFSFNGIDYIDTDAARKSCLHEISRVLKSGGLFIFSSHNARQLAIWPQLHDAKPYQIAWRVARCTVKSASIATRRITSGTFFRGRGYIVDPTHGGLRTFVSTPSVMTGELVRSGFTLIETVNGHYPTVRSSLCAPWHYYVCRKSS